MAHILIIDDDSAIRDVLSQILRHLGHGSSQAIDGLDGIKIFRSQVFDLVFTDIVMPGKDGIEVIRELNQLSPNLGIVAMSGGGAVESALYLKLASALGAVRVLPKPFSVPMVQAILDQLLVQNRQSPCELGEQG